jgi:hypothetical protein
LIGADPAVRNALRDEPAVEGVDVVGAEVQDVQAFVAGQ